MRVIRSKGILRRGVSREDAISQLEAEKAEVKIRLKEVGDNPTDELKIMLRKELLKDINRIDGRINALNKIADSRLHST